MGYDTRTTGEGRQLLIALLATLAFILSVVVSWRTPSSPTRTQALTPPPSYSYRGSDFPPTFSIKGLQEPPLAEMVVEDSLHYSVYSSAESQAEWNSLFPAGEGVVRLGPDRRPFMISMYHQLHCLEGFRLAMSARSGPTTETHACLGYLRQMVLCAGDTKLENSKPPDGTLRVCTDWGAVRQEAERNYLLSHRGTAKDGPGPPV